jgi:hypothetical protein
MAARLPLRRCSRRISAQSSTLSTPLLPPARMSQGYRSGGQNSRGDTGAVFRRRRDWRRPPRISPGGIGFRHPQVKDRHDCTRRSGGVSPACYQLRQTRSCERGRWSRHTLKNTKIRFRRLCAITRAFGATLAQNDVCPFLCGNPSRAMSVGVRFGDQSTRQRVSNHLCG